MYAKAHKTVEDFKARGFEVVSKFTGEESIFLLRDNWGVAVPKSEKAWREKGVSPLSCWYWNPSSESEEEEIDESEEEEIEDYFILLEEAEQKRKLFCEKIGVPYHPF